MKKLFCAALVGAILSQAQAQNVAESTWGTVIDGRIQGMLLLDLVDSADPIALARDHGVVLEYVSIHSRRDKLMIARVDEAQLMDVLNALSKDDRVAAVSPNYVCEAASEQGPDTSATGTQKFPDDPLYKIQWNLHMVNVESGWKKNAGQNARVAMVDTGLAYWDAEGHHKLEDLVNTKVLEGYDFVRDRPEAMDEHGQGSHMAGTIAQSTNNSKGAAGIAYETQIMPFKVLDRQGRGSMADVAAAIRLAGDRKAQVIVLGLGGPKPSEVLHEAVKHARAQGAVLIAATGSKATMRSPTPPLTRKCWPCRLLTTKKSWPITVVAARKSTSPPPAAKIVRPTTAASCRTPSVREMPVTRVTTSGRVPPWRPPTWLAWPR